MKHVLVGVLFISSCVFVYADSYDGPFCYEPVSMTRKDSEDPQTRDDENIRGTCKKIEFNEFYEIDPSLREKYFFLSVTATEEPALTLTSTTSPVIENAASAGKYYSTSDYLGVVQTEGSYCNIIFKKYMDKGNVLPEDDYKKHEQIYEEVHHCLDRAAYRLGDIFNFDKIESANATSYKDQGEGLVPITSPLAGYNQYWTIKEAPSGKIYRDNVRSEEVLDSGVVKILTKEAPQSEGLALQEKGFFAKLVAFFRNLF